VFGSEGTFGGGGTRGEAQAGESFCATGLEDARVVLAALYLSGCGVRLPRVGWRQLRDALRRRAPKLEECERFLRQEGFRDAAALLAEPWRLRLAESLDTLTALDFAYPLGWEQRLRDAAPPVLWRRGPMPASCRWLGVVGRRHPTPAGRERARRAARSIAKQGILVVSGGALGCDRAARDAALEEGGEVVEVVPYGFGPTEASPHGCLTLLSVRPPGEPFSAGAAMERNRLIYAAGPGAYVAEARLREGGSWAGALGALRARLGVVAVPDDGDPAHTTLCALGARSLASPEDFPQVADREGVHLFSPT
jgi:predicted Rossmann fold nucleotide-binding protein DprA/Smf involved in DNA uptake